MKISRLRIKNYKSIRELYIEDVDYAVIFVGKNNTGKTTVLDAIRVVMGDKRITQEQFYDPTRNLEITIQLEILEEDLQSLHEKGIVSKYKNYDNWKKEFLEKIPDYHDNSLTFTYNANPDGKVRFSDSIHKHNPNIPAILPKVYFINHNRNIKEFQHPLVNK